MKQRLVAFIFLGLSILLYAQSNKVMSWIKDSDIKTLSVKRGHKENTSFDNVNRNIKLSKSDISLFGIISPEETDFDAVYAQYVLNLSDNFTTIIFSYEREMELNTILVNYNLKGEYIDEVLVAFDEVAESAFSTTSIIKKDKIIVVDGNYYDNPPVYTTNTYSIEKSGEITEIK